MRFFHGLVDGGEVRLVDAAIWAIPIVWNVFESGAWSDARIGISLDGIVDVVTSVACVFFHRSSPVVW